MKFSVTFKYSNVVFKNKETKETISYDTKGDGNTFTFDNIDEDVVLGIVKGLKDKKASQVFSYDNLRTNFIDVMARNKCKELYDKLDKGEWKIEDIAISNITIKDLEFTKPTMNARETITVESNNIKKKRHNGNYSDSEIREILMDLVRGCPTDNPVFEDLVDLVKNHYWDAEFGKEKTITKESGRHKNFSNGRNNNQMKWKKVNESIMEGVKDYPVIFKKDRKDGEIVAFFPETLRDGSCNPGNIMSYVHDGQHGEASIDYFNSCRPCRDESEYADLLKELKRIYENDPEEPLKLKVMKRIQPYYKESNDDYDPRYDNAIFWITVEDEEGNQDSFRVDITEDTDWGDINTTDGTCYYPSGEPFDGIGYGNDNDGYEKIVKIEDSDHKKVSEDEFIELVEGNVDMFN